MSSTSMFDGANVTAIEKRIEQGKVFEIASTQDISNVDPNNVGYWLLHTGDKDVIAEVREVISNGNELTYQAFKNPTIAPGNEGTPLTFVNRSGRSDIQVTSKFYEAPTVAAEGVSIPSVYMPGAVNAGNRSVGQFSREGQVRVLERNTQYLIKVTNEGDAVLAKTHFYLMISEHKPVTNQ